MSTSTISSPIDTGKITGRRELHFNNFDEAVADAEQLAAAERDGGLKRLGNWTLGQALGHLAGWINAAFDGNPLKPPLLIRLILRPMKGKFLRGPMRAGVKIPKVENGTLATEIIASEEGLSRFRAAADRLKQQCPQNKNVIFGRMTHDEWIRLNLRHAELHLSFFQRTK